MHGVSIRHNRSVYSCSEMWFYIVWNVGLFLSCDQNRISVTNRYVNIVYTFQVDLYARQEVVDDHANHINAANITLNDCGLESYSRGTVDNVISWLILFFIQTLIIKHLFTPTSFVQNMRLGFADIVIILPKDDSVSNTTVQSQWSLCKMSIIRMQ